MKELFEQLNWPIAALVVGAVGAIVAAYGKFREFVIMAWGDLSRPVVRWRSVTRRARRRALFADGLESSMRRLAEQEEWRDSRFAELEAEVELERESPFDRIARWFGRPPSRRIHRVPSLTEALREKTRARLIILEGDPGAGKSVALRHLAQKMALRASRRPSERSVLPVYVNLKTFRPPADRPVTSADVQAFVLECLSPSASRDIDDFLAKEFDTGREEGLWLFLFDSFDEIPAILGATEASSIIEQYADAIAGFIGMGRSRAVIASREFRGPSRLGWPRFEIMPLTRKRRVRLIRRADLDNAIEKSLLGELDTLETRMPQLMDNPLFLSLVCEYARDRGSMPDSIHGVLESYVMSRLVRDRERIERRFAVTVDAIRAFAEEMAYQMLSSPSLGLSVRRDVITNRVAIRLNQTPDQATAVVDALIYSKLLKVSPGNEVTFAHRRLHEYFATRVVINQPGRLQPIELLTNGRWRETAVAVLQTQPPEESADLLSTAESLLRASLKATGEVRGRPWQPGVLHLLDLLANSLKPGLLADSPIGALVGEILRKAWEQGDRLDRKWVVELCASAGTDRMIDYITRAFDSESLWLRDQAYAQIRRIGVRAAVFEPQIRQMLVDMSVGGELRRTRRSVRTQLQRLPNPVPLQRVVSLLLAAPVVVLIGSVCGGTANAASTGLADGTTGFIVLATVVSVLLKRLALASASRVQRYARRYFARFGINDGDSVRFAAAGGSGLLLVGIIFVMWRSIENASGSGSTSAVVVLAVGGWLVCWSHGALLAAAKGAWQRPLFRPFLPLYLIWSIGVSVGRNIRELLMFAVLMIVVVGLVVAAVIYGDGTPVFEAGIVGVGIVWGLGIATSVVLWFRQLGRQYADSRAVVAVTVADDKPAALPELQDVLARLHTSQGVQAFLEHVRKQRLHRVPDVAEFLFFLSRCLEREHTKNDELSAYWEGLARRRKAERAEYTRLSTARFEPEPAPSGAPEPWNTWWLDYQARGRTSPLRHPTSETLDELGSILEDAQRAAAFTS